MQSYTIAQTSYLVIERRVRSTLMSFLDALAMLMSSFYVFNMCYPPAASLTSECIQR